MAQKKRCIKQVAFEGEGLMKYQALAGECLHQLDKETLLFKKLSYYSSRQSFLFFLYKADPLPLFITSWQMETFMYVCVL